MRASIAMALLVAPAVLAFAAMAAAKPSPLETQYAAVSADDTTINTGASGAMLEAAYFHAPLPRFTSGRMFPCRMQVNLFDKTRLTGSCH